MKKLINKTTVMSIQAKNNFLDVLSNKRGDTNVGQAIAILITIVIGALLLSGLYTLFSDVVLPTVTSRVQDMFNYNG